VAVTCTVAFTGVDAGTATVSGTYGVDASHNPSPAGTSTTISVTTRRSSDLACSTTGIIVGQTSTCTATVTDTTTASRIATGTVTFTSNNIAVGTVGASCALGVSGTCTVAFTGVATGHAAVSGTYGGDANHLG